MQTFLLVVRGDLSVGNVQPIGVVVDAVLCRAAVQAAARDLARFVGESRGDPTLTAGAAELGQHLADARDDLAP